MDIRLQNLTKIFTDRAGKETRAVDDLTVTIASGKLIGLLGPSGCGKSTTLFMIAGLFKPSGGKIFFGDDDVTRLAAEKRGIGLVFQNYALYPHMTVRQNIMFPLENINIKRSEALELVKEMAELVDIAELLDRKPAQLSGGQQQRVAIARALVKKPRVLLLDEPLSNLDARLRLQTREEIKRIQRETGITTIFVTHDQEEAMSISDEMVVLNFGVQQQMDHPQEIYNNPNNLFVAKFLGNPPINILQGHVKDGKIYSEGNTLLGERKVPDGEYTIGIRPEDFKADPEGIEVNTIDLDHIGRDTLIR
ncbi:MAG: ABC transporter ATP-binding protein, partial [Acholeplasmataceae bacterium]